MRILVTILLSISILACPNHQVMKQGDKAPCDGHFFNNKSEEKIRKEVRDSELKSKQLELKDLQVKSVIKDRDKWKEEAENQAKARHAQDGDLTKGVIYGAGFTLLLTFLIGKVK